MLVLIDLTFFWQIQTAFMHFLGANSVLTACLHTYIIISQSKSEERIVSGLQTVPAFISHQIVCEFIICYWYVFQSSCTIHEVTSKWD